MIRARAAFALSLSTNSPLQNSHLPICRPLLRFSQVPLRSRRIQIAFCAEKSFSSSLYNDDFSKTEIVVPSGVKSVDAATLVGVATLASKILGFLREVVMASVFGVGPVATAFKYAWVLPGFSSSLLGGVNGPIHIIMSTTLRSTRKGDSYQAVLAGPVGLGFGYMRLVMELCAYKCLICAIIKGLNDYSTGAILLSYAASIGLFLQWIIQVIVLWRGWSDNVPDALIDILKSVDVRQFFLLLLPAIVSSGLAQIASFTDLSFASLIPGAAAGLSYAYHMVMAPLGALSSIIILPLVPKFSKVVKTSSWESLVGELERALLLCMVLLLPIFSVMRSLAEPIIHIMFERFAFDSSACALVSSLFRAYSLGTPFFIAKDLLVAVSYALGDGNRPFIVSAGAVVLNAILDWLSVSRFNLGAKGLALSTSFTAALSVFILFHLLKRKLSGLSSYTAMIYPTILLMICCITSNITTTACYKMMLVLLASIFDSRYSLLIELLTLSVAGAVGFVGFFVPGVLLHVSGFDMGRDLFNMLIAQQSVRTTMAKSINL